MPSDMFWKCLFSPALYMIQRDDRDRDHRTNWEKYHPNEVEGASGQLINTFYVVWKLGIYTSPIIANYIARNYMNMEGFYSISRIIIGLILTIGTTFCVRSYGRTFNGDYKVFVNEYSTIKHLRSKPSSKIRMANKIKNIKKYDFDFNGWPVEYEYKKLKPKNETSRNILSTVVQNPCSVVSYVILHTIGIRMIYPGSTSFLNCLLSSALLEGRQSMLKNMYGERFKIKTVDGNFIDAMVIDLRPFSLVKAETLVICSEGNAGFYENGIVPTPLGSGHSVLGWNHPGFGSSTGMPFIDQEQNAIDAVVQFAIRKLGFPENNIILYGWSIGGYSSAWAAINYPKIKAIVLDAPFDDVLPLALTQMPRFLEYFIKFTIRKFADINTAEILVKYQGPIKIVRRTEDEVVSTKLGDLSTNRGNHLLKTLLSSRYPKLITEETDKIFTSWLEKTGIEKEEFMQPYKCDDNRYDYMLKNYANDNGKDFPFATFGENMTLEEKTSCLLYLAEYYMVDCKTTHCTLLPNRIFANLLSDILI